MWNNKQDTEKFYAKRNKNGTLQKPYSGQPHYLKVKLGQFLKTFRSIKLP